MLFYMVEDLDRQKLRLVYSHVDKSKFRLLRSELLPDLDEKELQETKGRFSTTFDTLVTSRVRYYP